MQHLECSPGLVRNSTDQTSRNLCMIALLHQMQWHVGFCSNTLSSPHLQLETGSCLLTNNKGAKQAGDAQVEGKGTTP